MSQSRNKEKTSYSLVTGASAGIGRATALELSKKKHHLILCARRLDRLAELKKECLKQGAKSVSIYKLDVRNSAEIKKLQLDLKKKSVLISVLVNAAGLAKGTSLVSEANLTDWEDMLETNVKGLMFLTQKLLEFIIPCQGHIVNLGSVAGRLVYEGGAVYCATKFAVRAFSDGLRMDLKGTGVRVSNIEPGMVNTEFSLVRLGNQQKADAVYDSMLPLTAEDIAKTILWCVTQPRHVNISELVIYPTDQASVGQVVRGEKSIKNLKSKG